MITEDYVSFETAKLLKEKNLYCLVNTTIFLMENLRSKRFKATAVKYGFDNPIGNDEGTEAKYAG